MNKKLRLKRLIWLVVGCVSFVLGTFGTFLPILPTVPLYLLAAVGFANWSEKLHGWFSSTKLYKKHLEGYVKAGGLTLVAKISLIVWVTLQIAIVSVLLLDNIAVQIVLGCIWLGFIFSMIFAVKTVDLTKKENNNGENAELPNESFTVNKEENLE